VNNETEFVTVYRSMDADAKENCEEIIDLLEDAGLEAVLRNDTAPGVPEVVFEVRVPAADAARAEELSGEDPPEQEVEAADPSSELDLETIASAASEMEATSITKLLESDGIAAVLVGNSVLPNLPFDVRVAHEQADRARKLIADAETTGPAAAEEAELESESGA
jgi:hypothetical protein